MRIFALVAVLVLAVGGITAAVLLDRPDEPEPPPLPSHVPELPPADRSQYVGRQACAPCHRRETGAYLGSDHDLALDPPTEETVLGDFDDATLTHYGVTSRFYRRNGKYLVETEGPDGKLAEFEVAYVIGVRPLQQYLIGFPDGRYQTLPLTWDSRPAEEGGQRWYHIHPDERVPPGDVLYWTGPNQNWNYVCAECHSTDLRKNYDFRTNTYATDWAEIDVSCEACHGAGKAHVEWAQRLAGLADERPEFASETKHLARLDGRAQIEMCARCHSRRVQISEDYVPGRPLLDTHRLALLNDRQYFADGQILDEVYVYGSFIQSRMFREGVYCTNCHDPHSLKTYAKGNALCVRCHDAASLDTKAHHHHDPGTEGSFCVDCHMPERTYMVVDPRRDHSLRIPRPDLTAKIGTPNACNGCHDDRSVDWAVEKVTEWYGPARARQEHYGEVLHAGRRGKPGSRERLAKLAADTKQPGIARATALTELADPPSREGHEAHVRGLGDEDPLVRAAAVEGLEGLPPAELARLLTPRLEDPVRLVRIEAARLLAPVRSRDLPTASHDRVRDAFREYLESEAVNADRGAAHANLGIFYTRCGDLRRAEAAYRTAIAMEPTELRSSLNLADLYRAQGREEEALAVLRHALEVSPDDAAVHHVIGLALVRIGRREEALEHLARGAELLPSNPRFSYVYGIALNSAGKGEQALEVLTEAFGRHPWDPDILLALATILRDRGEPARALLYAERLAKVSPDPASAARLVAELRAAAGK